MKSEGSFLKGEFTEERVISGLKDKELKERANSKLLVEILFFSKILKMASKTTPLKKRCPSYKVLY